MQKITGTLSVCLIVKNEAALLARCLAGIKPVADQIVVVDTGSRDNTVEIARSFGAVVIEEAWRDDFAWARNISLDHAECAWILWLDADDVVPASSLPAIAGLKKLPPDRVLGFIVRNQKPDGTGTEFVQARMFPNRPDLRFERRIHEQIMLCALRIGLSMESRDVVIEHHGYADQATLKCKAERNVKLMLEGRDTAEIDTVTAVEVADSYQLMEQWEEAIIWYKRVLSIPGCDTATPVLASQAHTGLGVIYNRQEKYDLAKSSLKKAVDLAPWRTDALFSLAVSYDLDGEKADAVRVLQKIIDSKPSPGQVGVDFRSAGIKAHLRLMRILADESDLSGAASAAQRALTAHPDRPEVAFMAAKIAAASGNLIEALKLYERCIALTGQGNLDVYIGLCLVYMKAGRIEVARKTLLSIEPLFSGLRRYRAFRMSILEEPAGHAGLTPEEASGEMAIIRRDFFLRAGAA